MRKYVYQRAGGPLVFWAGGQPPSQARGADAKSLGALGCGGGCGCSSCGPASVGDAYLKTPRGTARAMGRAMGSIPFLPGAPEPLTGMGADTGELLNPYEDLQQTASGKASSGIGLGTIALAGLGLALAWPSIKKALR